MSGAPTVAACAPPGVGPWRTLVEQLEASVASVARGRTGLVGIGIDVEPLARWDELVAARGAPDVRWLFSPEEHLRCRAGSDAARRYAACWCIKEAALKALAPRARLVPRDVHVVVGDDGVASSVTVVDAARRGLAGITVRAAAVLTARAAGAWALALAGPPPGP